jgi:cytochrome c oxidase subunit 2
LVSPTSRSSSSGVVPTTARTPAAQGHRGEKIDNLFWPVLIVAVLVGVFIFVAVTYCAIRFRRRAGNERPKQIHGNTALEIGWTLIPAVILAVIAVPTVSLIFQLNEDPGADALNVTAVGKQWWWQFDYPRPRQHQGSSRPTRCTSPPVVRSASTSPRAIRRSGRTRAT